MSKYVKITVLKRLVMTEIIAKYADKPMPACHRCEEGQVFVTDGRKVPEGFCVWAWSDIFKDILMVRQNAECGSADGKCQIASCTDGFRPVVFLVEPWESETA
jgi:TIGR04076 family protein